MVGSIPTPVTNFMKLINYTKLVNQQYILTFEVGGLKLFGLQLISPKIRRYIGRGLDWASFPVMRCCEFNQSSKLQKFYHGVCVQEQNPNLKLNITASSNNGNSKVS